MKISQLFSGFRGVLCVLGFCLVHGAIRAAPRPAATHPSPTASLADADLAPPSRTEWTEDFSSDPMRAGWEGVGDTNLFAWDAARGNLDVTWDSRRPNSYFWRPLGTVLTREDDFTVEFELIFESAEIGVSEGKPFTFELAVGLLNRASATNASFRRGTAAGTRNLVEFDYFPDFLQFGATVAFAMVSTNRVFNYSHNFPMALDPGSRYGVSMDYTAASGELRVMMTRDGAPFGPLENVLLTSAFTDFRVDAFSVSSYSDAGADGSLLARGRVDNVRLRLPGPPVGTVQGGWADGVWRVQFHSRLGWKYHLDRTGNFVSWTSVGPMAAGTGGVIELTDTDPEGAGYYRVRAERP